MIKVTILEESNHIEIMTLIARI